MDGQTDGQMDAKGYNIIQPFFKRAYKNVGSAYGNRNDSDQPAHQHSLVRAMAVHKKHVLVLTLMNECA